MKKSRVVGEVEVGSMAIAGLVGGRGSLDRVVVGGGIGGVGSPTCLNHKTTSSIVGFLRC